MPATTATTPAANGASGRFAPNRGRAAGPRAPAPGRRRQLPLVVAGVLFVIGGALVFAETSLHLGSSHEVLVVGEPLAAGQVLDAGELRTVRVATGSGLQSIPAGDEASVVGRPVAVPLVAGALLTPAEVGAPAPVSAGADVVALALKAGQYPPDLAAGAAVEVVPVPSSSSDGTTPAGSPVAATVLAVEAAPADSDSAAVFSLEVATTGATAVAALGATGSASLVQLGQGAGSGTSQGRS